MKFEDENFKEEFMKWLNNRTEEELVKPFKKYATNIKGCPYEISTDLIAKE